MTEIRVIEDPAAAMVALDPIRSRLLAELRRPASAATLASRVGMSRQKVNYHLRALEAHGLVVQAGERRWGGLTERELVGTASAYLVSPGALGPAAADPEGGLDRLSAGYLMALAARVVREVGELVRRASQARRPLATLSVDTVIRFRSARERAAFTREFTQTMNRLVRRYHDEGAPGGRPHRVLLLAHPLPRTSPDPEGEDHAGQER